MLNLVSMETGVVHNVPLNTILEWECFACTGDHINAAVESFDETLEVKQGYNIVGPGSLNPGLLNSGTAYFASVTLINEIFIEDALDLGANGIADIRFERCVDNEITFTTSPIPIPAALPLLLSGLLGFGLLGRARRKV